MGRDDLLPKTIGPGVVIAEAEAAAPRVWVVAAIPTAARLVPKKFAGQPGHTLHCGALCHWWIMSCAGHMVEQAVQFSRTATCVQFVIDMCFCSNLAFGKCLANVRLQDNFLETCLATTLLC